MKNSRGGLRRVTASVAVWGVLLFSGAPAVAVGGGHGTEGNSSGGHEEGRLTASVQETEIVVTGDVGGEGGGLEPIGDWEPPVCWYEPWMTAEEFARAVEDMAASDGRADRATNINSPARAFTDIYRDDTMGGWAVNPNALYGTTTYENYNLDTREEGLWWRGVVNPNLENGFRYISDCPEPIFWGDPVDVPDVENTLTDEILAEYAYDEVALPETEIEVNPQGEQLVNLPMWIWLDAQDFEPRTVRAELPVSGLWAETTAEPVSLTVDPGTEDALLYPEDGECGIDGEGRIGEPYQRGRAGEDPPCGVMYERSTHGVGAFELSVSLTWEVSWTGSQTGGRNELPSGTFETTHEVVVQESQAIVR